MIDGSGNALAFGVPGGFEWVIILLVALLIFGKRIPGMARSLGSGITEFKSGLKEGQTEASGKSIDSGDDGSDSKQGSGGEGS